MKKDLQNRVRIIGGSHRGRMLEFPDAQGLRPTSNPIRETLFNWLQPSLAGAICLDLFAGTGALGFEAASRGAAQVILLEHNPTVVTALKANQQRLGLLSVEILSADGLAWLMGCQQTFDLVFVDPPFHTDLLQKSLGLLMQRRLLKPNGFLYLEQDAKEPWPELANHLQWYRQKKTGQVRYGLARSLSDLGDRRRL